jgi:hypothetical protein
MKCGTRTRWLADLWQRLRHVAVYWSLVATYSGFALAGLLNNPLHGESPIHRLSGEETYGSAVSDFDQESIRWQGPIRTQVPWSDLIAWGALSEHRAGTAVCLSDGSWIVAEPVRLDAERVTADASVGPWTSRQLWKHVSCNRNQLAGILPQTCSVQAERDRWAAILQSEAATQDTLYLLNGDSVSGLFLGWQERSSPAEARIQTPQGILNIPGPSVAAIKLRTMPALPSGSNARWVFGFRDGSVLYATDFRRVDSQIEFHLAGGIVRGDFEQVRDAVCYVRNLRAPVQYLSDLEPVGYRSVPFLSWSWPYQRNRNVLGGRLRSVLGAYDVGLGLHATCRIAYQVPEGARRWEAEVAIDPSGGPEASAEVRVYVQRDGTFQLAARSGLLRADTAPRLLRVDVQGASQLALIADAADGWNVGDRVNLLLAHFVMP